MAELHTATVIADADLADTVEFPVRLAGTAGLLKGTFAKLKTYLGIGTAATAALDTDGALAANSDTRVPSQKAIVTYVTSKLVGMFDVRGSTDCSTNPNYPAASKGDSYIVTVAGKIGGAAGATVAIGDVYFATADNAGGTQAAVGASWDILVHASVSSGGGLLASNDLSDVASAVAAKDNISIKGADIASAATTDIGAATGDFVNVTGTTSITGLGTKAAGVERVVKFTGVLTLTYDAAALILPGAANIVTAAGDVARFRSLGAGNWLCVSYQRASGAALSGGSSTTVKYQRTFRPQQAELPDVNYAQIANRNAHPVLAYDTTTQETVMWTDVLSPDYAGGGLIVEVWAGADTAVTGTIGWDVAFERIDVSSLDTDADSFAAVQTIVAATVPGSAGQVLKQSVTFTNAQIDGLLAGELYRVRVRRDVANDTAAGDAHLFMVQVREP